MPENTSLQMLQYVEWVQKERTYNYLPSQDSLWDVTPDNASLHVTICTTSAKGKNVRLLTFTRESMRHNTDNTSLHMLQNVGRAQKERTCNYLPSQDSLWDVMPDNYLPSQDSPWDVTPDNTSLHTLQYIEQAQKERTYNHLPSQDSPWDVTPDSASLHTLQYVGRAWEQAYQLCWPDSMSRWAALCCNNKTQNTYKLNS